MTSSVGDVIMNLVSIYHYLLHLPASLPFIFELIVDAFIFIFLFILCSHLLILFNALQFFLLSTAKAESLIKGQKN